MNKFEEFNPEGMGQPDERERLTRPRYRFANPNTLLFMTGIPTVGKSTIAPIVASNIERCGLQGMDIIRLIAQEIEAYKPEAERNPFVCLGSCDSYKLIGDGSYSPRALVQGFNAYSEAVSSVLYKIVPKLELQGVENLIFEGVQLTPSVVEPFLTGNNRLIILLSSEAQIAFNRVQLYGGNHTLMERYSSEKLFLLQQEILNQSKKISQDKVFYVENTGDYMGSASEILEFLLVTNIIK